MAANDPSNYPVQFDADWTDDAGRTWRCYFEGDTDSQDCVRLCLIVSNTEVDLGDQLDGTHGDQVIKECLAAYDAGIQSDLEQHANDEEFERRYAACWGQFA